MHSEELANHERHMRSCLELARRAQGSNDVPVGSLVVDINTGRAAGEGVEAVRANSDPTAHAEIEALRNACRALKTSDLAGYALYTTVEPCPMCAYVIRLARISLVVSGTRSGNAEAATMADAILSNANLLPGRTPPLCIRGVLSAECEQLLQKPGKGI